MNKIQCFRGVAAAALMLTAMPGLPAWASPPAPSAPVAAADAPRAALQRALEGPIVQVAGLAFDAAELQALYRDRAWHPLWVEGGAVLPQARAVVSVLAEAASEGLVPADYFVESLEAALRDRARPVEVELLLSAAVMRYGTDLQVGRVAPRDIDRTFDIERRAVDGAAVAVAAALLPDPAAYLASLAPPHAAYEVLRGELAALRLQEFEVAAWPEMPAGPALRPGDRGDRVRVLRERLAASGDYVVSADADAAAGAEDLYDDALVQAVRDFQAGAGLVVDGIVGRDTIGALNARMPVNRIESVIATMERLRWLPADLGDDHLMVNIPSYTLDIVADGELLRRMDVIVGRADRQTPLFNSALTYLEFNPTWTMPASIAVQDYLPRLRRDPGYFDRNGYTVYSSWGGGAQQMNSSWVDWHGVGGGIRNYRIVQSPGPGNALGKVKFMMANNWSVYLHDTPNRDLFARDTRALSSGCVRLSDPIWLADHLLAGSPDWTDAARARIMDNWRPTTRINLPAPMPLYLAYQTAWAHPETGEVSYHSDIYGFDEKVIDAVEDRSAGFAQIAALD